MWLRQEPPIMTLTANCHFDDDDDVDDDDDTPAAVAAVIVNVRSPTAIDPFDQILSHTHTHTHTVMTLRNSELRSSCVSFSFSSRHFPAFLKCYKMGKT